MSSLKKPVKLFVFLLISLLIAGCLDNNSQDSQLPEDDEEPGEIEDENPIPEDEEPDPDPPEDPDDEEPEPNDDDNDDSDSDENETEDNIKEIITTIEFDGYCYNPDYPEFGPSYENFTINLDDYQEGLIICQLQLDMYIQFMDDHMGGLLKNNTGDIFHWNSYCFNKTNGEILDTNEGTTAFEGGEIAIHHSYLTTRGRGPYYESTWYFDIDISNCGEYPKYGGPGFITEPDPGNEWNATLTWRYLVDTSM